MKGKRFKIKSQKSNYSRLVLKAILILGKKLLEKVANEI